MNVCAVRSLILPLRRGWLSSLVVWPTRRKQPKNRKPILLITCFTHVHNISHFLCASCTRPVPAPAPARWRAANVKYIYSLPQRHTFTIYRRSIYHSPWQSARKRRCARTYATNAKHHIDSCACASSDAGPPYTALRL